MSWFLRTINDNLRKHLPCAHVDECPLFAARLDGTGERGRERLAQHHTIEDWLELETGTSNQIPGKKRVGTLHTILHCFICFVFRDKLNPMLCRCAGLTWSRGGPRRGWVNHINHINIFLVRIQIFLFQCLGEWAGVRGGTDQLGEQRGPGEGGQQGSHWHQDHPQQIPLRVPQLAASPHIPLLKHTSQSTCSYL